MKKGWLITIIALCVNNIFGQIRFNKVYDYYQIAEGANAIGYYGDGYILGVKTIGYTYEQNQLWLLRIDEQGDTLWTRSFCRDSMVCFWAQSSFFEKIGDDYFFSGNIYNPGNAQTNAFLFKITEQGDSVWMKTYGIDGVETFNAFRRTSDGGFILAGYSNSTEPGGDFYLVKTDVEGNVQWERSLGGPGWQAAYSVEETPDGGYLLGGKGGNFMAAQIVVIKTDGQGNQQWKKILGGNTNNDGRHYATVLRDSNYLVCGSKGNNSSGPSGYGYIAKLSPTGQMLWEKTLTSSHTNYLATNIIELSTGDFIVGGIKYLPPPGSNEEDVCARICKFTSSGELIWERIYRGRAGTSAYFYGIAPSNDGGILAYGSVFANDPLATQDAWLVKMDSDGIACDSIGCLELIVDTAEPEASFNPDTDDYLSVFPNPASQEIQVQLSGSMPEQPGMLYLYDTAGRQCLRREMGQTDNATLQVDYLASGMYWLYYVGEGQSYRIAVFIR